MLIELEDMAAARNGGGDIGFGFLNASSRVRLIELGVVRLVIEKRNHALAKVIRINNVPALS